MFIRGVVGCQYISILSGKTCLVKLVAVYIRGVGWFLCKKSSGRRAVFRECLALALLTSMCLPRYVNFGVSPLLCEFECVSIAVWTREHVAFVDSIALALQDLISYIISCICITTIQYVYLYDILSADTLYCYLFINFLDSV